MTVELVIGLLIWVPCIVCSILAIREQRKVTSDGEPSQVHHSHSHG